MSDTSRTTLTAAELANGRWLTIDAACKLLGVDQSTLRRWSDSGKVPVFRTPGGHRRYNEDDLRAIMRGEMRTRRRMSRQVLTDLSISAYESDYVQAARSTRWHRAYDAQQLEELRLLGRRLVDLAVRSISGGTDRAQLNDEARLIGERYGFLSVQAGLAANEAVEAFLFFRYPVIQAVTRFIETEEVAPRRVGRILIDMSQFLDDVLIATMAAYT